MESLKAKCSHCNSNLGGGYYLSKQDFEKLLRGEQVEPDEVIYCPDCGKLAISWDGILMFYKEDKDNDEKGPV